MIDNHSLEKGIFFFFFFFFFFGYIDELGKYSVEHRVLEF